MKVVVIFLMLVLAFGARVSFAQSAPSSHKPFVLNKEVMDEAGVDPSIQEKIETIKKGRDTELKIIRESKELTNEAKLAKIKALNQERDKDIDALLTTTQRSRINLIKNRPVCF